MIVSITAFKLNFYNLIKIVRLDVKKATFCGEPLSPDQKLLL